VQGFIRRGRFYDLPFFDTFPVELIFNNLLEMLAIMNKEDGKYGSCQ
jgi:hypothetical protein